MSLDNRVQQAGRQLQTHTSERTREENANSSQTAVALCRLIVAGKAATGAGVGHHPFDPINNNWRWATRKRELG